VSGASPVQNGEIETTFIVHLPDWDFLQRSVDPPDPNFAAAINR
jgi:hypothetical protein